MTEVGERINPWGNFTGSWIPNWLLERSEINSTAKLLYSRLCQYTGREKNHCWPSRKTLAEALGISVQRVDRAIKNLKDHGLIECKQDGIKETSKYYFLFHQWMTEAKKRAVTEPDYQN
ncbi:MAG: helix-turn-helix domain-containing protein [Acidobacteriia bacterium]|nr:helix-turn-helix domain-containing protein [Terriglobia bacterium]